MANKLSKIDKLTCSDHKYLSEQDECFYFGEYTAKEGYGYSDTNQLIFNFKKPMDRRTHSDWPHKKKAITTIASKFAHYASFFADNNFILVPIPPSKPSAHDEYDDRVVRMLRSIKPKRVLDIRELVITKEARQAFHDGGLRLPPDELKRLLSIDDDEAAHIEGSPPFAIFDDVLTTGSNFKAVSIILKERFPGSHIKGFFVARCIFKEQ